MEQIWTVRPALASGQFMCGLNGARSKDHGTGRSGRSDAQDGSVDLVPLSSLKTGIFTSVSFSNVSL